MNILCEPEIENEKVFEEIAKKKPFKNRYCERCQLDETHCNTCQYGKRGILLNIKEYVFTRYQFYIQNKKNLNAIQPTGKLDETEIYLLEESFKKSTAFKNVKSQLLEGFSKKKIGKCPYCMISEPNTLDHYFPKSKYPEYILFAQNLIPSCSLCNNNKSNNIFVEGGKSQSRNTIHFYYDVLPSSQFLKANFCVVDNIPQISFYLDLESDSEMNEVIINHFGTMGLLNRYEKQSNNILSIICEEISIILEKGNTLNDCIELLQIRAEAMKKQYGVNYWETCIYMTIIENSDQLTKLI